MEFKDESEDCKGVMGPGKHGAGLEEKVRVNASWTFGPTTKSVYLAGPVDRVDDPDKFRDELTETDLDVEWDNPLDKYDGTAEETVILPADREGTKEATRMRSVLGDDMEVVWDKDLCEADYESVDKADAIVVAGWSTEVVSRGTIAELQYNRCNDDVPVVMWGKSAYVSLSPFTRNLIDHYTRHKQEAIESLRQQLDL